MQKPYLLWVRSGILNENSDRDVLVDSENKVLKIAKLSESPVNAPKKKVKCTPFPHSLLYVTYRVFLNLHPSKSPLAPAQRPCYTGVKSF